MVNTHLGLHFRERRRQIASILGNDWILRVFKNGLPLIIAGDFNAGAQSFVYKAMSKHLSDVQVLTAQKSYPKATFYSRYPFMRLDHIFISRNLRCHRVQVPGDRKTRMVSDHLPLFCELDLAA